MHAAVLAWFLATAYCHDGRTSVGDRTHAGVVAADPRVLPIGSRIRIVDGKSHGTYTVLDTGHGVRGRKIDVFMKSCRSAKTFGRRRVNVTVLKSRRGRP
jgi:3D (Asp-Asp-Asp) domain-containing protein